MDILMKSVLFAYLVAVSSAGLTMKAMNCICEVESNCNEQQGCGMDGGSESCGPYQIKEAYWIDCGRLENDYKKCALDKACSERCINNYMARYGTYCTGETTPTDEAFARIHNGGPTGCNKSATDSYWSKVKACCDRGSGQCNY